MPGNFRSAQQVGEILVSAVMAVVLAILPGCSSAPRSFAPVDEIPPSRFSHEQWDALLHAHVHGGVVDYPAFAADSRFQAYLQSLARVNPNALPSSVHRLAFWINAYNALAIKGILDGFSPRTLWGRYRYFIGHDHTVGGRSINLYDLEQEILIPDFHDPRIHFAIVCASQSCPALRSEAYEAARLDEQLNEAAREFINDPAKNRFDRERRIASLSRIFRWFEHDFAREAGSLVAYVGRYTSEPELTRNLPTYRVEFLEYDWSLNGVSYDRPT